MVNSRNLFLPLFSLWLLASQGVSAGEAAISVSAEASSEPVPIDQMIEGWEDDAESGEFAFADMSVAARASYQNASVIAERRWFYSLKFSPDTTAVYLDAEFGEETEVDRNLDLSARAFQARGIGGSYRFQGDNWSVTPEFMVYRLIHYQFGTFYGRSFADEGTNFSARLSYYFDEYRFPDFDTLPDHIRTGTESEDWFGYSASISGEWQVSSDINIGIRIKDLWNLLDMGNSAHRDICAEVGAVTDAVCESGGGASGDDNPETLNTSVKSSVIVRAEYVPENLFVQYYWHDVYRNLSIEKRFSFGAQSSQSVGIIGTSRRQLGLSYRWSGLTAEYLVDDLNIKQVRDARVGLSYLYRW